MNFLVKILSSDDGEKRDNPVWCLVHVITGGNATLCGGEFFGEGESSCSYETKRTERGGITCEECLRIIKEIKSVKL